MSTNELLKMIAFGHASFMLGLCMAVLYVYFNKDRRFGLMQFHIVGIVLSHIGLTICTMITINKDVYFSGDPWFYVAGASYILTDISLFAMWKHQIRKQRREKQKSSI